jgi:molybdate transport system ATP-binding protein
MSAAIEFACRLRRAEFQLELDVQLGSGATGVFGRSGSGKTSLLHALCGLLPADHLRLAIEGETLVDTTTGTLPPPHQRRVGLVFQDHRLFPHLSIGANLRYGQRNATEGPKLDDIARLLDIGELASRRPAECSGGERQRVALGRALLGAPRLLLLDEPLASLDRGLKLQILPYLRRVREELGLPMLIVSHDLGDLLAMTDELLLIDGGRCAGKGRVHELAARAETLELLHDCGLVFALPGVVERRDEDGLAWVRVDGRSEALVACGDCSAPVGARVEASLRPQDVVLAREPLEVRTSLTNHLHGRVAKITHTGARVMVTIDCGLAVPVLAEVTERAVRKLELEPGANLVAMCKAQAILTRGLEAGRARPPAAQRSGAEKRC